MTKVFETPKLVLLLIAVCTIFTATYILLIPMPKPAGDIVEYYGITESLLRHKSLDLNPVDQHSLEKVLHKEYFYNPGYYLLGKNNKRYPVHFVFYSILATPLRIPLRLIKQDEIKALSLTNLFIFSITIGFITKRFLQTVFKKMIFLIVILFSPLISFILWPGPDLFFISLLLVAVFYFFEKRYALCAFLVTLASWHSQPLVALSLISIVYCAFRNAKTHLFERVSYLSIPSKTILVVCILLFLLSIPYLYDYFAFGVLTPWAQFEDGWTKLFGFGLQNISAKKLFEQIFDFNIGLFWYAPILVLIGFFVLFKRRNKNKEFLLFVAFLITALLYQTNPAWNYGTAGYGPTRHVLFLLPFLIYLFVEFIKPIRIHGLLLTTFVLSQTVVLSLNGFLNPNFQNSLYQNPSASFVLDHFPGLYSPTPEIFVDRTNHTDLDHLTTAIYKKNGVCKKAYVLFIDKERLIQECKFIPEAVKDQFENDFSRKTNYPRIVKTTEATFWPDPSSCSVYFVKTWEKPYICMKTKKDVARYTGITDTGRIGVIEDFHYPGIWKITWGSPISLTVPSGYIIDYYPLQGFYVTY